MCFNPFVCIPSLPPIIKQEIKAPTAVDRQQTLAATTALTAMAAANPAMAGDLFGPEYAGAIGNFTILMAVGIGGITTVLLPFITGTLNPIQMAVNLGIIEGEISNERKFKRNGEEKKGG